ncbi:MAG TPA: AAA family ATPase [Thermoleophilaceae bacterium]
MARPVPQRQSATLLERGAQLAALEEALAGAVASGSGRMVLVGGEAGVGKTSLLRAFCDGQSVRVFAGACDALFTPRPLGPFVQIAESVGGELEALVAGHTKPHELVSALLAEIGDRRGSVLVLEDLHWADEATLDALRLLARRVETVPTLVVASFRDDELDRIHPLRIVLGELATSPAVERVSVQPLSAAAVASVAKPYGMDAEDLHRRTGGNPFYVTEVLATGDGRVPATVRDAVLARAARLDPQARALMEAVAVVPPRAELWLLERIAPESVDRVDDCLASGMLTGSGAGVAFRHELARLAVEQSLTPTRALDLHRQALEALASPPAGAPDLARLAHHAEAAADGPAVLRFAPAAAARAASLGAHREAAAQYARALRFAEGEPFDTRADLLERASHEYYLSAQLEEALAAQEQALAYRRELGDTLRLGDALRALARLLGFAGRANEAEAACRDAIALLEQLEPSPELARAYGKMAQRRQNWADNAGAIAWGERSLELAERFDRVETIVYALTTIGTAEFLEGMPAGREKLERALAMARELGLDDDAGRAFVNLVWDSIRERRLEDVERYLAPGLEYCDERGLGYWWLSLLACRASLELSRGDWPAAEATATAVIDDPRHSKVAQGLSLAVLGLVRARRGDSDARAALHEALHIARPTGELQQIEPVVAAIAETAWLEGRGEEAAAELRAALDLALTRNAAWEIGELACWCRRIGIPYEAAVPERARPYALELEGHPVAAAHEWRELGCAYEAALALVSSGDEAALRQALDGLQRLGAHPAAAIVTRRLRELGARGLPRGPRRATRANEANLTPRELEVLGLVAEGLRNADIAARLFLSEKTVDHHVSAILRKLGARTRAEASVKAVRLGLAGQDG